QGRERADLLEHMRRPVIELADVVALEGELILRVAGAAADAEVLHRLQEQRSARHPSRLATEAADDLVGGHLALVERLEGDEHAAGVGPAAALPAGEGDQV